VRKFELCHFSCRKKLGKLDLIILNGGKRCGNLDFVIFYVGKSGKANAKIFSELAWNNFRIRVVVSDLNSEFRIFFRGRFGVFGQFRIFFRGQFGVFGQFRIFFPSSFGQFRIICGKKYGNSSKSSVFSRKYFFSHSEKSEYSELYFPS
jgi:hypothetical protein